MGWGGGVIRVGWDGGGVECDGGGVGVRVVGWMGVGGDGVIGWG